MNVKGRELNNRKRRLLARGGRRVRQVDSYVTIFLQRVRLNQATGLPSKARDQNGNFIVTKTIPAHMESKRIGRSFFHNQKIEIPEQHIYAHRTDEYAVRVAV